MLEEPGDLKTNYWDYMTTESINCNEELKRLECADYDLCSALLKMLLREDHFLQQNSVIRKIRITHNYKSGQLSDNFG